MKINFKKMYINIERTKYFGFKKSKFVLKERTMYVIYLLGLMVVITIYND